METSKNTSSLKENLLNIYYLHKLKILNAIFFLITFLIVILVLKINNEKKNNLAAENYIKAGLYLASGKEEESKKIFEKIINSKNKFYSLLSFNTLLEKNLISDEKKILEYFDFFEEMNLTNEQNDLISFKKGLFLIEANNKDQGQRILRDLINKESQFKSLAKDVITK